MASALRIPDGVWPVMVTPFRADGAIDWEALPAVVDWYVDAGVTGLFAVCLSSEMYELSPTERLELARAVVTHAAGRVPVVATGTLGASQAERIDGTLAMAMQWQGSPLEMPPLLAVHRPGSARLETLAAEDGVQRRTRNYAGSVAVTDDGRQAAITAPRGNMMLVFDLATNSLVEVVEATDICGVAAAGKGFACSTVTCSNVRLTGSIVVSHSSLASISPRPFSRWNSALWFSCSARNSAFAWSSFRYTFRFATSVEYSGCAMYT